MMTFQKQYLLFFVFFILLIPCSLGQGIDEKEQNVTIHQDEEHFQGVQTFTLPNFFQNIQKVQNFYYYLNDEMNTQFYLCDPSTLSTYNLTLQMLEICQNYYQFFTVNNTGYCAQKNDIMSQKLLKINFYKNYSKIEVKQDPDFQVIDLTETNPDFPLLIPQQVTDSVYARVRSYNNNLLHQVNLITSEITEIYNETFEVYYKINELNIYKDILLFIQYFVPEYSSKVAFYNQTSKKFTEIAYSEKEEDFFEQIFMFNGGKGLITQQLNSESKGIKLISFILEGNDQVSTIKEWNSGNDVGKGFGVLNNEEVIGIFNDTNNHRDYVSRFIMLPNGSIDIKQYFSILPFSSTIYITYKDFKGNFHFQGKYHDYVYDTKKDTMIYWNSPTILKTGPLSNSQNISIEFTFDGLLLFDNEKNITKGIIYLAVQYDQKRSLLYYYNPGMYEKFNGKDIDPSLFKVDLKTNTLQEYKEENQIKGQYQRYSSFFLAYNLLLVNSRDLDESGPERISLKGYDYFYIHKNTSKKLNFTRNASSSQHLFVNWKQKLLHISDKNDDNYEIILYKCDLNSNNIKFEQYSSYDGLIGAEKKVDDENLLILRQLGYQKQVILLNVIKNEVIINITVDPTVFYAINANYDIRYRARMTAFYTYDENLNFKRWYLDGTSTLIKLEAQPYGRQDISNFYGRTIQNQTFFIISSNDNFKYKFTMDMTRIKTPSDGIFDYEEEEDEKREEELDDDDYILECLMMLTLIGFLVYIVTKAKQKKNTLLGAEQEQQQSEGSVEMSNVDESQKEQQFEQNSETNYTKL